MPHLFCFGLGYCARTLAMRLQRDGWRITGTTREGSSAGETPASGLDIVPFSRSRPLADPELALADATAILVSIPPDDAGDVVLDMHGGTLARLTGVRWIGYLSTTGVYGDTGGQIVDETAPLCPSSPRSRRRVEAERRWLDLARNHALPVHVFRLAGIYGPMRSTLNQVRSGRARRIDRPNLFSRIHVDDVATILAASMATPDPGAIYNVCDDEPARPADVVAFACELLGVEAPPMISWDEAVRDMSPMAQSFWQDDRRVSNRRLKQDLGVHFAWPDYRSGLRAVLAAERATAGVA